MRQGQRRFFKLVEEHRICAGVMRRQYGKTTVVSKIALKKMMKRKDHTIIFGSAKLNLAREIVRKEAFVIQEGIRSFQAELQANGKRLQVAQVDVEKVPDKLDADAFAELFEAQRLEFRYYHTAGSYSRTKVVALLPDTVGETGDLICDEIGRVKNFREVWEAIEPIIVSNRTYRCILITTPPPDDTHFSFEFLAPPPGSIFPVDPAGNVYESELGITVLRVDAFDAFADGVEVYDSDKGEPLTPAEHRRRAHDKDAWDRNYGCKFVIGGTAACDLALMGVAQERGVGKCECFQIEDDADFLAGLNWLAKNIHPANRIGLGLDVATTTNETSNPSAFSIAEQEGAEILVRAIFAWKTRDPDVAMERIEALIRIASARPGGRPRGLAIDATNEKYFAEAVRKKFRNILPVHLIVASESFEKPGLDKPTNWKEYLGSQYVGILDDNHLTLPPQSYVKMDHRLVRKDRGKFVCEPSPEGWHGDTFDASKLAVHELIGKSGPFTYTPVIIPGRNPSRINRRQGLLV
jgi:hypothetical protein